ncbi:MAG TPA: glycoside hydrolase family protein [Kofleriaceae bacterium]|jgi:hypothetical protein
MRALVLLLAIGCGSSNGAASDGHGGGGGGGGDDGGGSNASSCKRGVAYGEDSPADQAALRAGVAWWYNWALSPDAAVASTYGAAGFEYVPMVWGEGSLDGAGAAVTTDEHFLLAFNEPDFTSQANLTPEAAAALWPQLEQIADAHGLALVSPALNYCGGGCNETDPFQWFDKFFAACPDCRVDALAVHWYACTRDALENYISQMKQYGKPIWLTEFSCLDGNDTSAATEQAYMADALDYLENEPAVARYAWFTGRWPATPTISLLGDDGQLTDLGQQYVSAAGACAP